MNKEHANYAYLLARLEQAPEPKPPELYEALGRSAYNLTQGAE